MAKDALQELAANAWVELTANDATTITIIHRGGAEVLIKATTGATPGASDRTGFAINSGRDGYHDGFVKKTITELSHTALVDRVWAYALGGTALLWVEHD